MIEIKNDYFLTEPYPYQREGVDFGINRAPHGNAFFADEMGVGKTKQAIDIASIYYENNLIDIAIVVCPAIVRGTWDNDVTGQIKQHCKSDFIAVRFDAEFKGTFPSPTSQLLFVTVSYSFLRARLERFLYLVQKANKRILLICDESSYLNSPKAKQRDAVHKLRKFAKYCILLNGTPVANTILDLWSQLDILDPSSIDNIGYYHFRARYSIPNNIPGLKDTKQYLDYSPIAEAKAQEELTDLLKLPVHTERQSHRILTLRLSLETMQRVRESVERLKHKIAPWIIRREKKDVLKQLPDKLPPVYIETPMSPEGYRIYHEMAEEMVAWANTAEFSEAVNGAVRLGRLIQITSGFLGGLTSVVGMAAKQNDGELIDIENKCREVDRSKLDAFLEFYEMNLKGKQVWVWCQFRAEMFRLQSELEAKGIRTGLIIGGQKDTERQEIVNKFRNFEIDVGIGHPRSGGFGLDGLQNHCYTVVYLSSGHSLILHLQSQDRFHRNGQKMPVSYIYFLATTPKGHKTVDHLVVQSVINKESIASWTMEKWRQKVQEI